MLLCKLKHRNTSSKPCGNSDEVSTCLARCLESNLISESGRNPCRLPFMKYFDWIPVCTNTTELQIMMSATYNATSKYDPDTCNCLRKCRSLLYTTESTKTLSESRSVKRIRVDFRKAYVEVFEETPAYNGYTFFSDLGGTLGLWLGLCILQILEIAASALSAAISKISTKTNINKLIPISGGVFTIRNPEIKVDWNIMEKLPGLNGVIKRDSLVSTRILWLLVSMAANVFLAYQCANHVAHYYSDSSSVNVRYLSNLTITLPSITICPSRLDGLLPAFNPTLIRSKFGQVCGHSDVLNLLTNYSLSIEEIWNMTTHDYRILIDGNVDIDIVIVKLLGNVDYYPLFGVTRCHGRKASGCNKKAVNHLEYVGSGTSQLLSLQDPYKKIKDDQRSLPQNSRYQNNFVMVHPEEDLPFVKYFIRFFMSYEAVKSTRIENSLRISQISYRNTKYAPCQSRRMKVQCLADCIERNIAANLEQGHCRLPYMVMDKADGPICTDAKQVIKILNATFATVNDFIPEGCNCMKSCHETTYTTEYIKESFTYPAGNLDIILRVDDNRIMVVEETPAYDVMSLFSDLGGALGLLSGISLLTMTEILAFLYSLLVDSFTKYCFKRPTQINLYKQNPRAVGIQGKSSEHNDTMRVEIPGFSQSVDNSKPCWTRCIWFAVSAGALFCCSYQVFDRIRYYVSDPSEVNTLYTYNKTIDFPAMVICPTLFTIFNSIDVLEDWNNSSSGISCKVFLNGERKQELVTNTATPLGMCYLLALQHPVNYQGRNTEVKLSVIFSGRISMLAYYAPADLPLVRFMSFKNSLVEDHHNEATITLRISHVIHRNTSQNPCESGIFVSSCLAECIESEIYAKARIRCRLPFMKESVVSPTCRTVGQYLAIRNASVEMINNFKPVRCNCPRKCDDVIYAMDDITVQRHYFGTTSLCLICPDNRFQVIQEVQAYTFIKLLSELGGTLGLFFGMGLLQILELLAVAASKLKRII